jgi:hypothetical protein
MDALGEGTRILCSPNAARSNAAKHPKRSPGDDQAHEGNPAEVDAPEAVERIVAGRWVEPIQALPAPPDLEFVELHGSTPVPNAKVQPMAREDRQSV